MSEEPLESAPEEKEKSEELPTPTFSEPQEAQPPSQAQDLSAIAPALMKQLEPLIQDTVEKQWQSGKDRRFARIEGQLDDMQSVVASFNALKSQGYSDEDALGMMQQQKQLYDRIAALEQGATSRGTSAGTGDTETMRQARDILKEAGISENDPEAVALFAGHYRSGEHFELEVRRFVDRKRTSQAAPASPAAVAPAGGGTGMADAQEQLLAQYNEEVEKATGGSGRGKYVAEIRRKYRDKGLKGV